MVMQKGAPNFTIVSTILLIGLNRKTARLFYALFSNQHPYNKISSESK